MRPVTICEQIADFSGGEMITGQIENDLGKASTNLRDSLKNLYVLGYQSANTAKDGKWRKLAVKVTPPAGVSKVKVEAKTGTSFRRDSEDGDSGCISGPKS